MAVMLAWPNLPSLEALTEYHPKVPLRVYDRDGKQIGEFGEERRDLVRIGDVPQVMKNAILAAEDDDFYQHHGIDPRGILRALYVNLSGGRKQGASTITQQVARNFFLSNERTLSRKFYEALLAFRIESHFTKDQILELYINQIFLGHRAYGFAAAAQTYFGKPLSQISAAEAAVLAGIPKSPSTLNPIASPKRAKARQEYVLRRMRELGMIDHDTWQKAVEAPIIVKRQSNLYAGHAGYVAEMARQIAAEMFPEAVYGAGLSVYTTVSAPLQEAAWRALREGILDYDRRQGFRGAEGHIDLKATTADED
ncbi:MAG: transglycosylase domain-containing protein, partial [Zoogloeaceae bacterium]|nr:transglycosylase domain-containing protein [Zoogloeaceae bacterium]